MAWCASAISLMDAIRLLKSVSHDSKAGLRQASTNVPEVGGTALSALLQSIPNALVQMISDLQPPTRVTASPSPTSSLWESLLKYAVHGVEPSALETALAAARAVALSRKQALDTVHRIIASVRQVRVLDSTVAVYALCRHGYDCLVRFPSSVDVTHVSLMRLCAVHGVVAGCTCRAT